MRVVPQFLLLPGVGTQRTLFGMKDEKRKPGELFLDRYAPNVAPEEREAARKNLHTLARIIAQIRIRLACENPQALIRENTGDSVESP